MIIQKNVLNFAKYAKIAYKQDRKTKEYLEKSTVFNRETGEIKTINFDKEWHLRQSYLYNTFRMDYLNQECINKGMIPIFITLTLPSEYHRLAYKGTRQNPNYDPNLTITNGYEKLNSMFRSIYNDFKIDRKRVKGLKFIRVIEPHKDWTPHLHSIVYIDGDKKDKFIEHINRIISKNNLKQTDIKELDRENYSVTYLLKYIDKTLSGDDAYRGWRMYHNIHRVITMSNLNMGLTRNIFKRVSQFIPFDRDSKDIYFKQILDQLFITRIQKDIRGNILKEARYGSPDSPFSIVEVVEVSKKVPMDLEDFEDIEEFEDIGFDDLDSLEGAYNAYRLVDLVVYNEELEELYNKRDYIFTRGGEYFPPPVIGDCIVYTIDNNFCSVTSIS